MQEKELKDIEKDFEEQLNVYLEMPPEDIDPKLDEEFEQLKTLIKDLLKSLIQNKEYQIKKGCSSDDFFNDSELKDILLITIKTYNSSNKGKGRLVFHFYRVCINTFPLLKLASADRFSEENKKCYYALVTLLVRYINTKKYHYNGQNYNSSLYQCIRKSLEGYTPIPDKDFLAYFDTICKNDFKHLKYEDTTLIPLPSDVRTLIGKIKKHFTKELIFENLTGVLDIITLYKKLQLEDSKIKIKILKANPDFADVDALFMISIFNKYGSNRVKYAVAQIFQQPKSLEFLENSHTTTKKEATNDIDSLPTVDPEFLKSMNTVYNNFTSTVSERQVISLWCSFHLGKYVKFHNDNPLILSTLANCSYYNTSVLQEIKHKDQSITQKYIAQKLHVSETLVSNTIAKFRKALIDELEIQHLQENKENITNQNKRTSKNNFRKTQNITN